MSLVFLFLLLSLTAQLGMSEILRYQTEEMPEVF